MYLNRLLHSTLSKGGTGGCVCLCVSVFRRGWSVTDGMGEKGMRGVSGAIYISSYTGTYMLSSYREFLF